MLFGVIVELNDNSGCGGLQSRFRHRQTKSYSPGKPFRPFRRNPFRTALFHFSDDTSAHAKRRHAQKITALVVAGIGCVGYAPDINLPRLALAKNPGGVMNARWDTDRLAKVAAGATRKYSQFSDAARHENPVCDFGDGAIPTAGNDEPVLLSGLGGDFTGLAGRTRKHWLERTEVRGQFACDPGPGVPRSA